MTVVAVLNQKGGVGKTTVTLGLTSAAWAAGERALVVDLDPQASATWGVGLEPSEVELGAGEVLLDKRTGLAAKAIQPSAWEGVDVLPMRSDPLHPPKDPSGADAHQRLRQALADVVGEYRWVFLDCPPELGEATRNALVAADLALVVAEPAALSVRGLAAVMTLIDDLWASDNPSLDLAGIVVNRVPAYHAEADLHVGSWSRSPASVRCGGRSCRTGWPSPGRCRSGTRSTATAAGPATRSTPSTACSPSCRRPPASATEPRSASGPTPGWAAPPDALRSACMYAWNDDWLGTTVETAIEPELPIIDPHHHLWDVREGMNRYLPPDLLADLRAGHNVEGTVFVDCMWEYATDGPETLRPVGESRAAARAAAEMTALGGPTIKGIVSYVDMTAGDAVDAALDAHIEAGNGLFRGIRHATAFDADPAVRRSHTRPTPGLMLEDRFVAGVRRLAAKGLTFDAWLYHPQISELTALARAVPEATIVLDHLGGPLGIGGYAGRRDEVMTGWRPDITELASCPNVVVKVGGIGMAIYGLGFEERPTAPSSDDLVAAWGGPITETIELFGADRCMFESNFPVDKVSCSYVVLWNAFKKIAAGASPQEKASLFHGTATRAYSLD
jgi:L-fuconolactonase